MTMTLETAALRIGRELRAAEEKVDEALLASARLMTELLTARQHPDVVVHEGQKALIRLAQAVNQLVAGGSNIFRVHDEIGAIGREMGVMDEQTKRTGLSDDDLQIAA
jgi:hypothetical protein